MALAPAGYVAPITTTYGGRPNVAPQAYHDLVATELHDPNAHPFLGPFQHTIVKRGRWSDPAVWSSGLVPGVAPSTAGQSVTLASGCETIFDIESNVILRDVFGPRGSTFTVDKSRDTRLRADTVMLMGFTNYIVDVESPTPGKPRSEIVLHPQLLPGPSARLGFMTMGPVRILGAKKKGHLFTAATILPAGAATIALESLANSGWRVGDTLVIAGTAYVPPATSDPQYDRPVSFHGPVNDTISVRTASSFQFNQDEERTITAISGNTVTLSAPLAYDHAGETGTLPHGEVVVLKPVVANVSRSIRFRTASAAADSGIDPNADLTNLQKRAHTMFMHHDDVDARYFETKDMGRTSTDPSLFVDGLPYAVEMAGGIATVDKLRATVGGAPLEDLNNVRGRYAIHVHRTGAYLGRRMVNVIGATAWAPQAGPRPIPGWAMTQHSSRASFEDCVVSNFRGAGMVSEVGDEIGQWIGNFVTGGRGDGFPVGWGDRGETHTNHNGHAGVAYESQARQLLQQRNIACGSRFAWMFHAQKSTIVARIPRDVDLRLWDPITQGGTGTGGVAPELLDDNTYGKNAAQIPDFNDNLAYACGLGFAMTHRGHGDRNDRTPMLMRRFHCLNVRTPWWVQNYSNTYYQYDSLWVCPAASKSTNTAAYVGNVTWRFCFVNLHIRNANVAFFDGGSSLNYDGFIIDCTTENCNSFTNAPFVTLRGGTAASHPARNVMGDWEDHPADASRAIVRRWRSLDSATELPTPYPLAPYGAKLPARRADATPYPAVAPGQTPYFVLGNGTDLTTIDTTVTAGMGAGQVKLWGIIRDSVGDTRWPDFQSSETGLVAVSVKGPRTMPLMRPEQMILRNGCFNDNGVWKTRLWFTDADRFTGRYFQFSIDITLTGFATDFLAANTVVPNPPSTDFRPEQVPSKQPRLTPPIVPPAVVSRTSILHVEGEPLSHRLRADTGLARWSIVGGADAAQFAISGTTLTWASNGTRSLATPRDAGGNNIYDVTIRCRHVWGIATDVPHAVQVLSSEGVSAALTDTFDRADETLEANSAYARLEGVAGAAAIRSNSLIATTATATHYVLADLGDEDQRATVGFSNWTGGWVLLRMVDATTWIGFRRSDFAPNAFYVVMCVAGVVTTLATFQNAGNLTWTVELLGSTLRVSRGGVEQFPLSGSLTLPSNAPRGRKVGLRAGGNANPWLPSITFERLPSQ